MERIVGEPLEAYLQPAVLVDRDDVAIMYRNGLPSELENAS